MELRHATPFYSQKWNLENWQKLGFKNYDDAKYWERSSCAILCLKMILDSIYPQNSTSVYELIEQGVKTGGYTEKVGWSHRGIVKLANDKGLRAIAYKKLTSIDIKNALDKDLFVIVSIKWAFEKYKTLKEKVLFWKKYGGHLALVVGYKTEGNNLTGFYVNHTSTKLEYNWENKLIPLNQFEGGFTGRGIVIGKL